MGLFSNSYYGSDEGIGLEELCDLSKALMQIATLTPKDKLKDYDKYTDMEKVSTEFGKTQKSDEFCYYMNDLHGATGKDKFILDDIVFLQYQAKAMKRHIDAIVNRASDENFMKEIKEIYDKHLNASNETKEYCEQILEREKSLLKLKSEVYGFEAIKKFRNKQIENDFKIGLQFIKKRQWLRQQIYNHLKSDPNITGKEICESINENIKGMSEDFRKMITLNIHGYNYYYKSFTFCPRDIYDEWNFVKEEIKNGTFGQNYPDNISDDIEVVKKQLKELGINIPIPEKESVSETENNDEDFIEDDPIIDDSDDVTEDDYDWDSEDFDCDFDEEDVVLIKPTED